MLLTFCFLLSNAKVNRVPVRQGFEQGDIVEQEISFRRNNWHSASRCTEDEFAYEQQKRPPRYGAGPRASGFSGAPRLDFNRFNKPPSPRMDHRNVGPKHMAGSARFSFNGDDARSFPASQSSSHNQDGGHQSEASMSPIVISTKESSALPQR